MYSECLKPLVDGLTSLLKQLDAKSKSATAKAKHYRERLSAAEAG